MKKHKKLLMGFVLILLAVVLVGGVFAYKHKQNACNSSSMRYPICLGGCNDPAYYNQHVESCKDFDFVQK